MNGLSKQIVNAIKAGAIVTFSRHHRDCIAIRVDVRNEYGCQHATIVESQYIIESANHDAMCHSLTEMLYRTGILGTKTKEGESC